ncbi:hypothetical protein acdb102_20590 [Acidothermaceae bacterium B102]|nr:hypothetical protein acdb102_20590 [Acidothermaceae bacterium B102]
METRDLFERLIADEPPFVLSTSAVRARGERAARLRLAYRGLAVAAVAAVVVTGVVHVHGPRHPQPAAPLPTISALPFSSPAQIAASNSKVYALLRAGAAKYGSLIKGVPLEEQGGVGGGPATLVSASVQYTLGRNSGFLSVVTSAPAEYASSYGSSFTPAAGPCAYQGGAKLAQCRRTLLPGGAVLWTYSQSAAAGGGGPVPIERFALLRAADDSVLTLSFSVQSGSAPGASLSYRSLSGAAPGDIELGQLAVAAAAAWQNAAKP